MTVETPKERDERLLAAWKRTRSPNTLSELLTNLKGPIAVAVNSYRGAPMPQATVELEGTRQAMQAIQDWDATKGVSLSTYVTTMVKQRLYRYIGTYQNVARLPEAQIRQIGPIREAMSDLTSRLGREATTEELADHLGLPFNHVARVRRNLRADLLEEGGGVDMDAFHHDAGYERAMMAYYQLNDQEKLVFDFSLGAHGQLKLKNKDIAVKLKLTDGRVSQLKKSIAEKLKPFLGD